MELGTGREGAGGRGSDRSPSARLWQVPLGTKVGL